MNRKILALVSCVLLCAGVLVARAAAKVDEKSFANDGLKSSHSVTLKINGAKVSGVYQIDNYDDSDDSKKFIELKSTVERAFSGTITRTKTGTLLKIYFVGGAPYPLPPKTNRIEWRIGKRGKRETLIVPTYGKNYESGKYAVYEMQLDACITVTGRIARHK